MQYKILVGDTVELLEYEVTEFLAAGWKPQGGVNIIHSENDYMFIQAITLD